MKPFSLAGLFASMLGGLMGPPHRDLGQVPEYGIDPHQGHRRSRGRANSSTLDEFSERFRKLMPSCRPPARRFYARLSGHRVPLDAPKRMKDRRKWRKANGYLERAIVPHRFFPHRFY